MIVLRKSLRTLLRRMLNNEIAEMVQACTETQLRSFLQNDIAKLSICCSNGIYKAAIFIARSLLEAVPTD